MLSYSVAIRTLGTSGEKFKAELQSIKHQTIQPDKVIVYIAEGYSRPEFTIGQEEYIWVNKGMVNQRALSYEEITSDVILFMDDDIWLAPDSVEKMLNALIRNEADAIGVDVFGHYKFSIQQKLYDAIVNLEFPFFGGQWAFKIKRNGSFHYNNNPKKDFYWSQKCDGPIFMIRKKIYEKIKFYDERWLDEFDFAYGDDMLETYKLYKNHFKLGIVYNIHCIHMDGGSASRAFRSSPNRMYVRTKATFMIWWRAIYLSSNKKERFLSSLSFFLKNIWLFSLFTLVSTFSLSFKLINQYVRGIKDGWKEVHSAQFKNLPPYKL